MKLQLSGLLFLIFLLPVFPAETKYKILQLPEDRQYQLAFLEFKTISVSPENNYLRFSIPLLLREKLSRITSHTLSAEQQEALRMGLIRQQLVNERTKLAASQKKKDELLFSDKGALERRNELLKLEKQIKNSHEYIQYLQDEPGVKIPDSLPVNFMSEETPLYQDFEYSVLPLTREKGIDLVILGTIEELHDYLSLEVTAFDGLLEKEIYSFRTTAESSEIYQYIEEATDELITLCVGRSWASLQITTDRPESRISINGELKGYGNLDLYYIEPEPVTLEVSYPGYITKKEAIDLEAGRRHTLTVSLAEIELEKISIRTNPPGANLYMNSLWVGITPLIIENKAGYTELLLLKEGYNPYRIPLTPGLDKAPPISLIPEEIDLKAIQSKKRDEFYFAMGIWAVSIPLITFTQGLMNDSYLNARVEGDYLFQRGELYEKLLYGSMALNAGLAVHMGFRLYSYIRSSDALTN